MASLARTGNVRLDDHHMSALAAGPKPLRHPPSALPDEETYEVAQPASRQPASPIGIRQRLRRALKAAFTAFSVEQKDQRKLDYEAVLRDADRASHVQSKLLPSKRHLRLGIWEVCYHYAPFGPVGGDFCDLMPTNTNELFFFMGDAVGKGVAGSLIATHLHAIFRTLVTLELPFAQLVERANRIFCESMARDYYATFVCSRACATGALELVNAGHPPPIMLRVGGARRLTATGVPLGLFYPSKYDVTKVQLAPGETLLFYTDGVTEARNCVDAEYGGERLARLAAERRRLGPEELVRACLDDVAAFTSGTPSCDDATLMVVRHV